MAQLRLIEVSPDGDLPYWEIMCPADGVAHLTDALCDGNPAIRGYLRVYREDSASKPHLMVIILPKRVIRKDRLAACVKKANGILEGMGVKGDK